jgi:hypothetical protein
MNPANEGRECPRSDSPLEERTSNDQVTVAYRRIRQTGKAMKISRSGKSGMRVVILVFTSSFALLARAQTLTLSKFADPNTAPSLANRGAIGFTYAGNKFVGSVYSGGQLYSTDLTGNNVMLFGPSSVLNNGSFEHYVSSSLGLGGFPDRDIYVGDMHIRIAGTEHSIVHISNDGTAYDLFVSGVCPSPNALCGAVRSILFDVVGTFGHDMLVATQLGNIYRVNALGAVSLLASLGEDAEGMDIIPTNATFCTFAGHLVVASEGSGNLRAISPTGVVTILNPANPIRWAEMVAFVPLNFGASGNPLEGFYESNYSASSTTAVWKANAGQFTALRGDLLVTSELTNGTTPPQVMRVHWTGTAFTFTSLVDFPPQPEDGILVTCGDHRRSDSRCSSGLDCGFADSCSVDRADGYGSAQSAIVKPGPATDSHTMGTRRSRSRRFSDRSYRACDMHR